MEDAEFEVLLKSITRPSPNDYITPAELEEAVKEKNGQYMSKNAIGRRMTYVIDKNAYITKGLKSNYYGITLIKQEDKVDVKNNDMDLILRAQRSELLLGEARTRNENLVVANDALRVEIDNKRLSILALEFKIENMAAENKQQATTIATLTTTITTLGDEVTDREDRIADLEAMLVRICVDSKRPDYCRKPITRADAIAMKSDMGKLKKKESTMGRVFSKYKTLQKKAEDNGDPFDVNMDLFEANLRNVQDALRGRI